MTFFKHFLISNVFICCQFTCFHLGFQVFVLNYPKLFLTVSHLDYDFKQQVGGIEISLINYTFVAQISKHSTLALFWIWTLFSAALCSGLCLFFFNLWWWWWWQWQQQQQIVILVLYSTISVYGTLQRK